MNGPPHAEPDHRTNFPLDLDGGVVQLKPPNPDAKLQLHNGTRIGLEEIEAHDEDLRALRCS